MTFTCTHNNFFLINFNYKLNSILTDRRSVGGCYIELIKPYWELQHGVVCLEIVYFSKTNEWATYLCEIYWNFGAKLISFDMNDRSFPFYCSLRKKIIQCVNVTCWHKSATFLFNLIVSRLIVVELKAFFGIKFYTINWREIKFLMIIKSLSNSTVVISKW